MRRREKKHEEVEIKAEEYSRKQVKMTTTLGGIPGFFRGHPPRPKR
jgi:hypothetical protein